MLRRSTALCMMMHRAASTHAYSCLPPLVTPSALLASGEALASVKFVDASWHLGQPQRVPRDEFAACRLPGEQFHDDPAI
jgi:hypothetical protein